MYILRSEDFPKTESELMEKFQQVWNDLPQNMLDSLILSFWDRLTWLLKVKDTTISHYLSKGMKFNEIDENRSLSQPQLFTTESDEHMMSYFNEIGWKWTMIIGCSFPRQVVKYRIVYLIGQAKQEKRNESAFRWWISMAGKMRRQFTYRFYVSMNLGLIGISRTGFMRKLPDFGR